MPWLGSLNIVDPKTLSPPKITPLHTCRPDALKGHSGNWTLGIMGSRSKTSYDTMKLEIIQPMLDAWGIPAEIILPSDGDSSHVFLLWAQQKDIPIRMISSDWTSFGRRASMIRDTTILREADRLIFLQGPRSVKPAQAAARLAKKGRVVGLSERPGAPLTIL
jgi:hypothetical protein